jgi:hypothetical protein
MAAWALLVILGHAVQRNQREVWDVKLASLKVGTTRNRLVEILGEPQRIERIGPDRGMWLRDTNPEESKRIKGEHKELVAYSYEKTFLGMLGSLGYVIYLDENEEKTLFKPYLEFFGATRPRAELLYKSGFLLSSAILAVLVWFFFRRWCARRMRKTAFVSGPDRVPEK